MAIAVHEVLGALGHFETFCSVRALQELVEEVRRSSFRLTVETAGRSSRGAPIHHLCCGDGEFKVLVVGFPHCHEPVGGMTVAALIRLLAQRHHGLAAADLEWHIVPCIDPDGAILNEGWTQAPFSFERYMKNRHVQPWLNQVDCSFPISYKGLQFDRPSPEARILKQLLDAIRPDFFFSLHNSIAIGGIWYPISRDLGEHCHRDLADLRKQYDIPLQESIAHQRWCAQYAAGIYEMFSVKRLYDDLERRVASPAEFVKMGAASWDYLSEIHAEAVTFVAELPHARYPDVAVTHRDESQRALRLRLDAANKLLLAAILEEWQRVEHEVNGDSPHFQKVVNEIVSIGANLSEGVPLTLSAASTHDLQFNPMYSADYSQQELCDIYVGERFNVLCHAYEFVRLLKSSERTPAIVAAEARLERIFDEAFAEMSQAISLERIPILDCDTLVRVQLGSGLIALNAALSSRAG